MSAPAASAQQLEHGIEDSSATRNSQRLQMQSQQAHRRSRMSVHSFLPGSVSRSGVSTGPEPPLGADGTRSPPIRKLRKTRSIPSSLSGGAETPPTPSLLQRQSVGRPHAHSVSSVDALHLPVLHFNQNGQEKLPQRDIFADVLTHDSINSSPLTSSAASHLARNFRPHTASSSQGSLAHDTIPESIVHPFGPGVYFNAPSWQASPRHLVPSLREMQSFESGLTARAEPHSKVFRLDQPVIRGIDEEHETPRLGENLSQSPLAKGISAHTKYSTELFDVLQNYRGLPALDKLSPTSTEMTIKLSLKADNSAAPRDDPRFVIWGETDPYDPEDAWPASSIDVTSAHPSRRRSTKDGMSLENSHRTSATHPHDGGEKLLIAATIERWLAQLTSQLDHDELLIFFLTYRTYVSAVDLGHLLICRFHWALQEPSSSREEMIKRIVRVRTYTAIRYWMSTFFQADFVPNRELRLLFSGWLNFLKRDPFLQTRKDALVSFGSASALAKRV